MTDKRLLDKQRLSMNLSEIINSETFHINTLRGQIYIKRAYNNNSFK
jgi:hypothetical protein